MGLLSTRWEGEHQGHTIVVARNEIGRGFKIEWDGEVIASRAFSFLGLGELAGTANIDDQPVEVKVVISLGGLDGTCTLTVGDEEIPMKHTK